MAPSRRFDTPPAHWQPPGQRWGFGARAVLPYLNHAVQAKLLAAEAAADVEGPIRNPVFPHMEIALKPRHAGPRKKAG